MKCSRGGLCRWEGTLSTLPDHTVTCEFVLLPCPMQCRDTNNAINHFMRKYLVKHVNDYCPNLLTKCKYCDVEDTLANIENVHSKVCTKTPFSCPNAGCCNIIKREALKRHLADCEHAQVACKYARLGCNAKIKKRHVFRMLRSTSS